MNEFFIEWALYSPSGVMIDSDVEKIIAKSCDEAKRWWMANWRHYCHASSEAQMVIIATW